MESFSARERRRKGRERKNIYKDLGEESQRDLKKENNGVLGAAGVSRHVRVEVDVFLWIEVLLVLVPLEDVTQLDDAFLQDEVKKEEGGGRERARPRSGLLVLYAFFYRVSAGEKSHAHMGGHKKKKGKKW